MEFMEKDQQSIISKNGLKNGNDEKISMEITGIDNGYRNPTPAVSVQNSYKKYGKGPPILNNFTMTVERGTIYGLLGASGCGKTTILSCIVGLRRLDSGNIKVFGAVPGTKESGIPGKTIGYMPQEIALYTIFTIQEILQYFGRIYGMTYSEIQSRMEFLINVLDLPHYTHRISELSGGQQRRTSLAVAMIHQPELLILDEPTVGVDPLVRESIWEYLCEIVARRKTTVIITTHYIEEARQSHMIGLMRNGRLLTEKPPLTLLKEHNAILLEDIVLKLCKKDNSMIAESNHSDADEVKKALAETTFYNYKRHSSESEIPVVGLKYKSRSPDDLTIFKPRRIQFERKKKFMSNTFGDRITSHMNIFRAVVIRNILSLVRFPLLVISFLFIPALQILLFNQIVGSDPKFTLIGVINNEFQSMDFLETCVRNPVSCFNERLSCNFLNSFPEEKIKWVPFSTEDDALSSVKLGRTLGYVSIPTNFTRDLKERSMFGRYASNDTLVASEMPIRLDMSYNIKSTFVRLQFYKYYVEFIKSVVSDCGGDPRTVELPMKYKPIYGKLDGGLIEFMQPSQVLLIMFLLPMASGVHLVWDKKAGTLDRTLVAGTGLYHIFAAYIVSEGLMMIIELALCFAVLQILNFQILGSVFFTFLICLVVGITGLSFGFLFGTICNHEIELFMCVLAVYMPVLLSSGGVWPLESVVLWARAICNFLPMTLAVDCLRSIVNRGWGITHPIVWYGFASQIGWIVFCSLFAGIVHRMRK